MGGGGRHDGRDRRVPGPSPRPPLRRAPHPGHWIPDRVSGSYLCSPTPPGQWEPAPACDESVAPACVATVPGFPGCLEVPPPSLPLPPPSFLLPLLLPQTSPGQDETYPVTALQLAIYRDPLLLRKWVEQPGERGLGDGGYSYRGYTTLYTRDHWGEYPGFLCPSQVTTSMSGTNQNCIWLYWIQLRQHPDLDPVLPDSLGRREEKPEDEMEEGRGGG